MREIWEKYMREIQGRAASADEEAAASHTEDLAEIMTEGGCTKQQIVNEMKQPQVRRCHPGLYYLERRNSLNVLSSLLRATAQKKKIPFKILPFSHNVPGHQELWWRRTWCICGHACEHRPYPFCSPRSKVSFLLSSISFFNKYIP